jgi:hypothetical protein
MQFVIDDDKKDDGDVDLVQKFGIVLVGCHACDCVAINRTCSSLQIERRGNLIVHRFLCFNVEIDESCDVRPNNDVSNDTFDRLSNMVRVCRFLACKDVMKGWIEDGMKDCC